MEKELRTLQVDEEFDIYADLPTDEVEISMKSKSTLSTQCNAMQSDMEESLSTISDSESTLCIVESFEEIESSHNDEKLKPISDSQDDLYADFILDEQELRKNVIKDKLKDENSELKGTVDALTTENQLLKTQLTILKNNISALFKTADIEIKRKNLEIHELRQKLDNFIFRRRRDSPKSAFGTPENRPYRNYQPLTPPPSIETPNSQAKNVFTPKEAPKQAKESPKLKNPEENEITVERTLKTETLWVTSKYLLKDGISGYEQKNLGKKGIHRTNPVGNNDASRLMQYNSNKKRKIRMSPIRPPLKISLLPLDENYAEPIKTELNEKFKSTESKPALPEKVIESNRSVEDSKPESCTVKDMTPKNEVEDTKPKIPKSIIPTQANFKIPKTIIKETEDLEKPVKLSRKLQEPKKSCEIYKAHNKKVSPKKINFYTSSYLQNRSKINSSPKYKSRINYSRDKLKIASVTKRIDMDDKKSGYNRKEVPRNLNRDIKSTTHKRRESSKRAQKYLNKELLVNECKSKEGENLSSSIKEITVPNEAKLSGIKNSSEKSKEESKGIITSHSKTKEILNVSCEPKTTLTQVVSKTKKGDKELQVDSKIKKNGSGSTSKYLTKSTQREQVPNSKTFSKLNSKELVDKNKKIQRLHTVRYQDTHSSDRRFKLTNLHNETWKDRDNKHSPKFSRYHSHLKKENKTTSSNKRKFDDNEPKNDIGTKSRDQYNSSTCNNPSLKKTKNTEVLEDISNNSTLPKTKNLIENEKLQSLPNLVFNSSKTEVIKDNLSVSYIVKQNCDSELEDGEIESDCDDN